MLRITFITDIIKDMQIFHNVLWIPYFQGGVVFSNIVTTVSPTYAQEVRTAEVRTLPLHWFCCIYVKNLQECFEVASMVIIIIRLPVEKIRGERLGKFAI